MKESSIGKLFVTLLLQTTTTARLFETATTCEDALKQVYATEYEQLQNPCTCNSTDDDQIVVTCNDYSYCNHCDDAVLLNDNELCAIQSNTFIMGQSSKYCVKFQTAGVESDICLYEQQTDEMTTTCQLTMDGKACTSCEYVTCEDDGSLDIRIDCGNIVNVWGADPICTGGTTSGNPYNPVARLSGGAFSFDKCYVDPNEVVLPVTAAPVTSAPITSAPATEAPITSAPVTAAPVTSAPITSAPITSAPITSAPISIAPESAAPVTSAPVSAAPVTAAPVSSAPVSAAPVSAAPVSEAPVSNAPVSVAPVSAAPVTATPAPLSKAPIVTPRPPVSATILAPVPSPQESNATTSAPSTFISTSNTTNVPTATPVSTGATPLLSSAPVMAITEDTTSTSSGGYQQPLTALLISIVFLF